jgi:hypothetical protein
LLAINTDTVVFLNLIRTSILGILHSSDEIEDDRGDEIALCGFNVRGSKGVWLRVYSETHGG